MSVKEKFFKIGLFNAGSLGTNHDDFIALFERHNFDIMAVNETWLKPGEEARAPVVPGYRLRHSLRPDAVGLDRGGGVGFYLKKGLRARTITAPQDSRFETVEQMWLHITVNNNRIAIGTAYRPPWHNLNLFLDAITASIASLTDYDHVILLGDFNVDFLIAGELRTKKVSDFLTSFSLKQIVSDPTNFTDSSQTLLDLVCTDLAVRHVSVEAFGNSTCGHAVIVSEFQVRREKLKPYIVKYRPFNNICENSFYKDLIKITWDSFVTNGSVDDLVSAFNRMILTVFDAHAPIKTCRIKEPSYPWITDNIKLMMRLRNNALAQYRRTRVESKKIYYKQLKTFVVASLYKEKIAYFNHNINNKLNDSKVLWKNLKSTILRSHTSSELPSYFSDPDVINTHFLDVPGKPGVEISQLTYFEYCRFHNATFSFTPVSEDTVSRLLLGIRSNSEGYDQINIKMLMLTMPHTLHLITNIINMSLSTSTFPTDWKVAKVRPIPKKNNPRDIKDLRPISLLPCLSKVLERVVCQQLTAFLDKHNIVPKLQSGFRKKHSTSTALLNVTDDILTAQDQGMCTLLVLLDYSRAFDCINVSLLLSKLQYYGFDHCAIQWFHSYLVNRKQYVELCTEDGTTRTSSISTLKRGVPQGSILGPILFILYCSDLPLNIINCKYHIYADDVQLYISFKPLLYQSAVNALNQDLDRVAFWSNNNCLELNPAKTKYIIFGTTRQLDALPTSVNVSLLGESIQRVYEAKNLGVTLDANLRFEKHIATSIQNCFYRIKLLYRIRPFLSQTLRVQLVESLVLSKLNYTDTVYGPRLLARTKRFIQRVQNAAARFCFTIPPRTHVTPFLNNNGVLKMKSRRKLHLACLLFNIIKYREPCYLYEKLSWRAGRRGASRQCSQPLSIQKHNSAAFRGCFKYAAAKVWNNIPPPIRSLNALATFRCRLKQYLLDAQKDLNLVDVDNSFI